MKRPSGGAIAAGLAGLVVVVAGVWGQVRALDDAPAADNRDILIAGVYHAGEGQPSYLFVRSLLTRAETTLDEDATFIAAPTWSPDGERLAWIEVGPEGPAATIVIWERANGVSRRVPAPTEALRGLEWSPDSQLVAVAGHPLRVIDTRGRVVATGPTDASAAFDIRAPLRGWSADSSRYALIAGGSIVHFDRDAGRIAAALPSEFGLTDLANGYAAAGWNHDGTLALFAAETMSFDVNFDARTSVRSQRSIEEFGPRPWREEALSELVTRVAGLVIAQTFGDSADGRGNVVVVAQPLNRARVFVDDGVELREFEYLTTDFSLRSTSVVLVGDWPTPDPPLQRLRNGTLPAAGFSQRRSAYGAKRGAFASGALHGTGQSEGQDQRSRRRGPREGRRDDRQREDGSEGRRPAGQGQGPAGRRQRQRSRVQGRRRRQEVDLSHIASEEVRHDWNHRRLHR